MNPQQRRHIIDLLERGEDLPRDYEHVLFPPDREYELVYADKEREADIIADTMAVPLREVRTFGEPSGAWKNRLLFGDNLQAMKTLLEQKKAGGLKNADGADGVRLIYLDPPFATQQDFHGKTEKAYQDRLVGSRFIEFLRKRLILMRELLSKDGSIYVHLDENKSHYIKVIMDEIFDPHGYKFQREIIWRIGWVSGYKTVAKNWIRNHDVILYYAPKPPLFNKDYIRYQEGYVRRDGSVPEGKGYPYEDTWNCSDMDRLDSIQIMSYSGEKTGYPNQKNENLLERIIRASSNPGDIVLDAFAGAGTICAVAEKLGRRWIGIDCGKFAISTTQKRVLNLKSEIGNRGRPLAPQAFALYNAGLEDFSSLQPLSWEAWRCFALQLFECRDEPHTIHGMSLDGKREGHSVHVFNLLGQPGKRMDEETVQDIHARIGDKIGNRFFIIAPRNVFDFQQDYVEFDGVKYYALRIPNSFINALHARGFSTLRQSNDEFSVNDFVDAYGFDFIQPPTVDWTVGIAAQAGRRSKEEAYLHIRAFESRARLRDTEERGGLETLSMLMLDYDYNGKVFDFDQAFYADQLEKTEWRAWFPVQKLGMKIMAVFMDIHGNESQIVIPRALFISHPIASLAEAKSETRM